MTFKRVAVVGGGTMGAGIAQVAAVSGCRVTLVDLSQDVLDTAEKGIRRFLDRSVEKGKMAADARDAAIQRIDMATTMDGLGDVELAIEAVVENMDVKRKVFADLAGACRDGAILATNTSSLRVSEIAETVGDRNRVVGMHFFNPAALMPLVEVIAGRDSSPAALDSVTDAAKEWGKVPVRAKDTPGFIVNRVARGYYLESMRILDEGWANIPAIDRVMKQLGTFRMGPFELMDLVGIDVNYAVSCSVYEQSGEPARLKPHEIQKQLAERGEFGRKTKRGFYQYDGDEPVVAVNVETKNHDLPEATANVVHSFCDGAILGDDVAKSNATDVDRYVFARVLATIMNEAALTYGDEVATKADIDTAMKKGTNYPMGPIEWAEKVGLERVGQMLEALNENVDDDRFAPAKMFG